MVATRTKPNPNRKRVEICKNLGAKDQPVATEQITSQFKLRAADTIAQ